MGYWRTPARRNGREQELIWGDAPADILGVAIDRIIKTFIRDMGRKPTEAELLNGMRFSARTALDDFGT